MQHDDPRIQLALDRAAEARGLAYAPYSGFHMGAAVVTDRGTVVPGALVENVSLGLAMCAGRPQVLALVARLTSGSLTWPCGACLQVAMELGGPDLVVAASNGKRLQVARLGDLAPNLPHKPGQPRPG